MILTIILIILLILIIYLNKNINENFLNTDLYKKIDNNFYNKVIDVTEPKYNKILKFKSNDSKINVKLESNDYSVERDDNKINIINVVNPKKNIKYSYNVFPKTIIYDNKMKKLLHLYKDGYINKSNFFIIN